MVTLYSRFADAAMAERAIGALLDHGGDSNDMSAVFPNGYQPGESDGDVRDVVDHAAHGITTTTPADAASGAGKGAGIGLGLGALAALASLTIPGFGLITGGGALATALAGVAGATVGGAVAGGVTGFLQDQGVPQQIATDSEEALKNGSAVFFVHCPSGKLGEEEVREVLLKYQADIYGRQDTAAGTTVDQAVTVRHSSQTIL